MASNARQMCSKLSQRSITTISKTSQNKCGDYLPFLQMCFVWGTPNRKSPKLVLQNTNYAGYENTPTSSCFHFPFGFKWTGQTGLELKFHLLSVVPNTQKRMTLLFRCWPVLFPSIVTSNRMTNWLENVKRGSRFGTKTAIWSYTSAYVAFFLAWANSKRFVITSPTTRQA